MNRAPIFVDVLHNVEKWLNERNLLSSSNKNKLAFATDGYEIEKFFLDLFIILSILCLSPWDFANFLQMQCRFSSIPYPGWALKWINVRKEFSNFYPVRRGGIESNQYEIS